MAKLNVEVLTSPTKDDHDAVLNALLAYNKTQVGTSGKKEITFHLKDEDGRFLGGANGHTHWNYFFVAHLWLAEGQRGKGLGKLLLEKIESEAVKRNCTHCWLDTFSFQAAGFYEKQGYQRFGQLEDYPKGHTRYFYFKRLSAPEV